MKWFKKIRMKWLGLHLTGFDARGRLLLDVG